KTSQFKLGGGFAHDDGGLIDQLVIEIDCLSVFLFSAINRGQRELAKRRKIRVPGTGSLLEVALRGGVVEKLLRDEPHEVARHVGRMSARIFIDDVLKLFAGRSGTLLRRR